jgi:CO/xanthine dehydrogenase Mo-binding subunit
MTSTQTTSSVEYGVGTSPQRPDGVLKVRGEFAYSSDLWADGMLWGATVRSPHPHARIVRIDLTEAVKLAGVVLTHEDVPGGNRYGLEHADQPVLSDGHIRYQGEPVAIVAADHPETARRAAAAVRVEYEVLDPVTDPEAAFTATALHTEHGSNLLRHVPIRRGAYAEGAEPTAPVDEA